MADDTNAEIEPMDFHCCDTPRGMLYYNMKDLTASQQVKLNKLKIQTVREDEEYLAGHPEIRACIALITRYVLKKRPRNNVHETIAQFFSRSKIDIQEEINAYLKERKDHKYEGDSAVGLYAKSASSDSSFEDISTFDSEPESFSDSLRNIGVNLNEIQQLPSGTVIGSISQVTDTGLYHGAELEKITRIIHTQLMEDLIVSEILDKITYDDEGISRVNSQLCSDPSTDTGIVSSKVSFCPVVEHPQKSKKKGDKGAKFAMVESIDNIIEDERFIAENASARSSLKSGRKTKKNEENE